MIRILQVVTPLHIGSGTAVGAVDLPVQRERHTGWPLVPATALKGALRERCRRDGRPTAEIQRVFGSEPGEPLTRGQVEIGDGILVALAVRSLQGTFALLTSPLALARLARQLDAHPAVPETSVGRALAADTALFDLQGQIVLEDLPLLPVREPLVGEWASALGGWIRGDAPLDHLLVVHDDVLAHACAAWLPVRTRAALEDGLVRDGHLFTTESVPPESLFAVRTTGDDGGLFPPRGEVFVAGGQKSIGLGRLAWYGEAA